MDDSDEEPEEEEKVKLEHIDKEAWREDLEADLVILLGLQASIREVMASEDSKLEKLVEYMSEFYSLEEEDGNSPPKKALGFHGLIGYGRVSLREVTCAVQVPGIHDWLPDRKFPANEPTRTDSGNF